MTGHKRLGMWLFVMSDVLTFATLLVVYTALRLGNPDWPRPFTLSPAIVFATGMTVVLLASSLTMVWAVAAMEGLTPNAQGALTGSLPSAKVPPGQYTARLFGASGALAGEYKFEIKR